MKSFIDPNETYLKIAIASDLHAYDPAIWEKNPENTSAPSHLRIDLPEDQPEKHPITGLIKLIKTNGLSADLLLCPGDIGHQAMPSGIQYAWRSLQKVKEALNARLLAATSGNHDVDSRHMYNYYDAKGVLQALAPSYPFASNALNEKYWAWNFALRSNTNYKLVVLNSSAYHGSNLDETEHGRISDATLSRLKDALSKAESKMVNLLMCHHHPQKHEELNLGTYDDMINGQSLLDLLGSGDFGQWIVIHGHKHHPKICYASGGGTAPVVLSAGSLCASLFLELQTSARNQFYLVYIPVEKVPHQGLVGRVQSWDWVSGRGWLEAGSGSGLPHEFGFGARINPHLLAQRLAGIVKNPWSQWDEVRAIVPELDYLIPLDYGALKIDLNKNHHLDIVEEEGLPSQLGRIL